MGDLETTFQELLSRQIKIRNLQGQWRKVSSLTNREIEELWNETIKELGEQRMQIAVEEKSPKQEGAKEEAREQTRLRDR